MPTPELLEVLLQNSLQALLIIAYLAYELRFGRGKMFMDRLDSVTLVLLAVVEEMEEVDTKLAYRTLNEENPDRFKVERMKKDDDES